MKRWMLFLLLLPVVVAKVGLYTKGFDVDCYSYTDALQSLKPETPLVLSSYLKDLGFDIETFDDTADLDRFDAVVVPACTKMDPEDVDAFLAFYRSGGGLVVDVRRDNPLAEALGVVRSSEKLESVNRRSFKTVYVEVTNGIFLEGGIVDPNGPIATGLEHLFYVGSPLVLPKSFNSGVLTPTGEDVLGWKKENGRVVVTGCLYCSGPLLLAEMIDWAEDGVVDFPRFSVKRRVVPKTVEVGGLLSDEITAIIDRVDRFDGEYVYNVGGDYCNFDLLSSDIPNPQPMGDKFYFTARFNFRAGDKPTSCLLPPVLLHIYYLNDRRDVIVDPVQVEVTRGSLTLASGNTDSLLPFLALAGLFLLVALVALYRRNEKDRLVKRYLMYKRLIRNAQVKRMKGQISEEAYKKLISDYEAKLEELETEMEIKGIPIPSINDKQLRPPAPRQPPTRRGRTRP